MQEHTLIANSGIQIITFPLSINTQEKFKMWYHEWYDTENGEWRLDPVYELRTDDECYYYNKQKLHKGGYLSDPTIEIDVNELKSDDILPLRIEDENCPGVRGDIFSLTFSDKDNKFSKFKKGYRNVLVILTDGYLYYELNKQQSQDAYSYVTSKTLLKQNSSMIVKRKGLQGLEVLMLETNPYSPKEHDRLQSVLENWFEGMEIGRFVVSETDLSSNTETVIDNFLNGDK